MPTEPEALLFLDVIGLLTFMASQSVGSSDAMQRPGMMLGAISSNIWEGMPDGCFLPHRSASFTQKK